VNGVTVADPIENPSTRLLLHQPAFGVEATQLLVTNVFSLNEVGFGNIELYDFEWG